MDPLIAETLADGRWLAWRYDAAADEIHFARAPEDIREAANFLSELRPSGDQMRAFPRSTVAAAPVTEAPLHFIVHSGLGGSTLLARALDEPGIVTTLKEPPILTDVVAFALTAPHAEVEKLCSLVARLLARPITPGEAVIVKMNSVGNGLAVAMAAERPRSGVLCLRTPLDAMLSSLARRGLEGRLAGRKLFIGMRNARLAELGFSGKQLFEQSDLQLAALSWVAVQRLITNTAAQLGPDRTCSISSEQLFERPRDSLTAIARHFGIELGVDQRLASGIFEQHAKTGEAFDSHARDKTTADTLAVHGDEIRPIVEWAQKVAQAQGIAWDLPYPILG